jgi:predicted ATPase/DNA-binding SARP family transcriptional activator
LSPELLIDEVWGDAPPHSVRASLQVHIAHVRRALGEIGLDELLASRPAGYALEISAEETDVGRFEDGLALVRALIANDRMGDALNSASTSLALWRGDLFADAGLAAFVPVHRARLEAVRVELLCAAVDLALMVGQPSEVLGSVELAIRDHPYDEQLWCASARLLYGLDRQADAIERLATLRRTLLDDLGLDPAPATLELEKAILNQDPELRPSRPETRVSVPSLTRSQFPPLRTLIGRQELVQRLGRILAEDRLESLVLTLVGPAGVGKTAVATHVASTEMRRFTEGAIFVDLSAVAPGGVVWPAVAAAVGLKPSSPDVARHELVNLLRSWDQLVILDGCEHVVRDVAELLHDLGESMTIIVTSRSPLNVPFERVHVVEPLSPVDMTELFLGRARAADSRFDPSDEDGPAIQRVVEALDGLPLAAELTAPLVRSMTPHELANTLERAGGVPETQRRLHDATEFSISLLGEDVQELLARISVFASGTDMRGIRSVCSDDQRLDGASLTAQVHSLVDASLLVAERTPQGMWYRMLHPIRMVAAERLPDDRDISRRRHARYLIDEIRRLSALAEGENPLAALDALDRHAANIRQAWHTVSVDADDVARAELLGAFSPLALAACQRLPDASAWLAELASAPELLRSPFDLEVTLNAAMMLGLTQEAYVEITTRAVEMAAQRGDTRRLVVANALLTEAISERDNVDAAERGVLTLDLARQVGDGVLFGFAVAFAVNPMLRMRDFDRARSVLNEALTADTSSYGLMEPLVLYQVGRLEMAEGNLTRAKRHFGRAEQVAGRTARAYGLPYALWGLAQVARNEGRVDDALALMHQVAALDRIMAPTQVGPHYLWLAGLAFEFADEDEVARCLTALGRPGSPLEFVCEQTIRGFLALLRNAPGSAREHFDRALDKCATSVNTQLFLETTNSWRLSVSDDKAEIINDVLGDVADRSCPLDVALQRLRAIAEPRSSPSHRRHSP